MAVLVVIELNIYITRATFSFWDLGNLVGQLYVLELKPKPLNILGAL